MLPSPNNALSKKDKETAQQCIGLFREYNANKLTAFDLHISCVFVSLEFVDEYKMKTIPSVPYAVTAFTRLKGSQEWKMMTQSEKEEAYNLSLKDKNKHDENCGMIEGINKSNYAWLIKMYKTLKHLKMNEKAQRVKNIMYSHENSGEMVA